MHGLQRADVDYFTMGEWLDVIIECNEIVNPSKESSSKVRIATQADFDRF